MASTYLLSIMLLMSHNLWNCASAAVHGHGVDTGERESDGAYRPRDSDHYGDSGHNVEFDHEAILGSVKEAEEFDKLSPEEAKERLSQMLPKMDLNYDKFIDRLELTKWIMKSFSTLSREEAQERMSEADADGDGLVTWAEYLQESFGVSNENEIDSDETGDSGLTKKYPEHVLILIREEREMWRVADKDGDGALNFEEFEVFSNPEEHEEMHPYLVNQTMREKDTNRDGKIDFGEYVGERGQHSDPEWMISEKEKFEHELDRNHDGVLSLNEVHAWVIPDNSEIAAEEVEHLFAAADDDHDGVLSFGEVLAHHDVFVGSEADHGNDVFGDHFDDEL